MQERKDFQRAANALHSAGFVLRPGAFPCAPQRNVSEVELVPPGIQHFLIEAKNAITSDARGRRNERGQAVVNGAALRFFDAREKMPDGERVALASLGEDFVEVGAALFLGVRSKIKFG